MTMEKLKSFKKMTKIRIDDILKKKEIRYKQNQGGEK
jgi:hypothetical protein